MEFLPHFLVKKNGDQEKMRYDRSDKHGDIMSWIDIECAQIPVWENTIPWLYLDNAADPNATTAQGYLVANLQASLALPWKNQDGTAASVEAITADWNRVKAMAGGYTAEHYKAPTSLLLDEAEIQSITRNFVEALHKPILSLFPAFDSFPEPAQVGISDLAYNPGIGKLRSGYPQFCIAVKAQDWTTAAAQSARNSWMPAFKLRNEWTAAQFTQAAQEAA